ncbi:MAG: ABC transporter ATP-binding protein [Armatimonadota bacterium]|nr:ABC transporter ATP-binding protein [Armatimonadota bacterium]MDR7570551.1 ABC transporter ATP-binding protein [Armatimonadota bacterium]MDR7615099.1 ABC transporter ATP-binding protein [Armatimonadota bacterium]
MIRWQGVTVRFGDRLVLRGVTLEVSAGQRVAVVGPNGAGKTTLLRCMLDLVPYEGTVTVGGFEARREGTRARALVGYVPQLPAFPPHLTAAEVVALVQELRGETPDPWSLLEQVGLREHGRKPAGQLSGGMLRRLGLAVALVGDPPVLVLDEPTSYLDREGEAWLAGWLREATGKTVVVASHQLRRLERLVDRVVALEAGEVVADVTAETLQRLHWVEVVVQGPHPVPLPAGVEVLASRNGAVHLRVPDALLLELLKALEGRPFRVHEPEVEDLLRGVRG